MEWRVRTSFDDRPGVLAEIARACGEADVNILGMQVFPGPLHVTDEFVIETPAGWGDLDVAALFQKAGGRDVAVTRGSSAEQPDATTRYLNGLHEVLEDGRSVDDVLHELLDTATHPDVADYTGHDVLDLVRRDGSTLRLSRAVPFTPVEKARAQALLALAGDSGADQPASAPSTSRPVPLVRTASLADLEGVVALHGRCSAETLYARYQTPLRLPMTTRMARRLVMPETGTALVAQAGLDVVGHATLERLGAEWTCQLIVEDAWQGRGIGPMLVKTAAQTAKASNAATLVFITVGSNNKLLKAVGAAGFVARVERRDENIHISVPLASVRALTSA